MAGKKSAPKVMPTVKGMRSFTGHDGRVWTKFLLSDGTSLMEAGTFVPGKFILAPEKSDDGEVYIHVYQAV